MAFVKKPAGAVADHVADQKERKHKRDCGSLAHQLCDSDPSTRRWAARDLVECPDASAVLVRQLRREMDASVREIILTTLTRQGDEEAVAGLIECLRSEDASLRNEAIEAMKLLPAEVAPIMGGLLSDPDPDVRIFAVNVLESLRHGKVEEWLKEVIESDPHVNVCATAVDLLGEVGTPFSREALENLKARFPDQPYISFAADIALKRILAN